MPRNAPKKLFLVLGAALISLVIIVAILAYSNRQLERRMESVISQKGIPASYGSVWEPFFISGDSTLLVLSNPPVYRFWNPADPESLSKRSIDLSTAEAQSLTETLRQEQLAQPRPQGLDTGSMA